MDDAIYQGVRHRLVVKGVVPGVQRKLAGAQHRALANLVVDQFQQVVLGSLVKRLNSPVVQNQQIELFKARQFRVETSRGPG